MSYFVSCFSILILLSLNTCKAKQDLIQDKPVEASKKLETRDEKKKTFPISEYIADNNLQDYDQAVFAGGCFWCTEACMEQLVGVVDVVSGYSGGEKSYPSYGEVGQGTTGHAEAIYIFYDAEKISYETLLDVFFVAHDPTTLNRQGPDSGEEYRSAIYFQTMEEQKTIDKVIKALNASNKLPGKIVSEVAAYKEFWVAEAYHQNYFVLNPNHSYVNKVSRPKVNKVIKTFPELIKLDYRQR